MASAIVVSMSDAANASIEGLLISAARSVCSLAPAVSGLDQLQQEIEDGKRAAARGYFTADEDDRVRARFAQYLTARAALHQTIAELAPLAMPRALGVDEQTRLRAFAIAYAAACLLVRGARILVLELAADPLAQRKLDEAEPRFGIPPRQYRAVYKSLTDPTNIWRLYDAREFARANRNDIEALAADALLAPIVALALEAEPALDVPVRLALMKRLHYRLHSFRQRRASAVQRALFAILEAGGRVVAEIHNPLRKHPKRVTPAILAQIESMLDPGDVIITRHDDALSNLFLPGFWPHASLHIGPPAARRALSIAIDENRGQRWVDPVRTLEARKDGVLFRPLHDTLSVDSVAIIRPRISQSDIAAALSRALTHEGKLYNFDFDFFRSDRLACTGVIHRAYDGIGGLRFDLKSRAGRLTLSAEDILDLAVEQRGFEAMAVFGVDRVGGGMISGEAAREALERSYRINADRS